MIETRETARKDYFNNAPVFEVDRQIKQMLLDESDVEERDTDSSAEEDWKLPIPDYVFPERARLVENFYGPDAEDFHEDKLLTRRIQVTKDMVALLLLCEPSRRGNRVNWDLDEERKYLLNSPSNWRLMTIHKYVQQMFASSAVVNLVARRRTLLRINFLPSDRTHFVVIPSILTCFMHSTGSAATGKHVALFPSLPKSPNF